MVEVVPEPSVGEEGDGLDIPLGVADAEVVGDPVAAAQRVAETVRAHSQAGLQRARVGAAGAAAGVGDERPVVVQHGLGALPGRGVRVGRVGHDRIGRVDEVAVVARPHRHRGNEQQHSHQSKQLLHGTILLPCSGFILIC